MTWGVLWYSKNKLDGERKHLICRFCVPVIFSTRQEARFWIEEHYGYIKKRKDLRAEPHGWRLPKPVKVTILKVKK